MRVTMIGKYPPIQGGVSTQTFGTARELARRGHEVSIVTNATEVPAKYRHVVLPGDNEMLGGHHSLGIRMAPTVELSSNAYVPWSQPYLSKLVGRLLETLEPQRPDLILASYLEPYGVAAYVAALALQVPYVVRPAGSDLRRLSAHPDLRATYSRVLHAAKAVILSSNPRHVADVAPLATVVRLPLGRVPGYFRRGDRPPVATSYGALAAGLVPYLEAHDTPDHLVAQCVQLRSHPDPEAPTILTYGKVDRSKGTFDALAAVQALAEDHERFNFIAVPAGDSPQIWEMLESIFRSADLRERTTIWPPVAPWHVPALLRRATAVCVLERAFPIAFHAPALPREIMAAGRCLVCSAEIATKQYFRRSLVSGENAVIVQDPTDHASLIDALRQLIRNEHLATEIGGRAGMLSSALESNLAKSPLADYVESLSPSLPQACGRLS